MKKFLLLTLTLFSLTYYKNSSAQVTCGTIPFTIVISQVQIIPCNGMCTALLIANVSGGVGPFTFQWVGGPAGATYPNLCAGSYTLIVIDMGQGQTCTASYTINEPPVLTTITTQNPPTCATSCNGVIVGTQTGGTPGYTMVWTNLTTGLSMGSNPTQTGICNGQYQYCVTDAIGCSDCDIITVNQTLPCAGGCGFTIASTTQPAICTASNGSACINVTGGSGNYSYLWSASAGSQTTACAFNITSGNHCVTITDISNGCDSLICVTVSATSTTLVATAVPTMVSCGGVCDANVNCMASGGTAPYTYSLDNPTGPFGLNNFFTGVCAGVHVLYVKDANGCQTLFTFQVFGPSPIVLTYTSISPSCATACDGSVTVSATGGTGGPYQFTLNGGPVQSNPVFSGLCNGVQNICAADANGCSACIVNTFNTVAPCNPCGLTIFSTTQPAICTASNGSACVNVTGGTGPYVYSWSASAGSQTTACAFNIPAGNHCITVYDQGNSNCDSTICLNVSATSTTIVATAVPTSTSCPGVCDANVNCMATGGTAPYTYSLDNPTGPFGLNNFFTNVCEGVHVLYVKDANGCLGIYTFIVTSSSTLSVTTNIIPPSTPTSCDGILVGTATGGTPNYVYAWYDSTGTQISNQQTYPNACSGAYTFCVTDANGCTNCDSLQVGATNAVAEWNAQTFSVYPNPSENEFNIRISKSISGTIEIVDALGRKSYNKSFTGKQIVKIDIDNWSTGMYVLKISNKDQSYSTRIIKK